MGCSQKQMCVCLHFICCILHKNSNTGKHILDKYILLKFCFVRTIVFFCCIVKNTKIVFMKIIPTENNNCTILLVNCFNN